ncbi:MAG: hypothetical protein ACO3A2_11875 [Bdellovibrionia bacterium]
MSTLLTRINTAIQMSIVNQKYARAQALNLTANSPYYPAIKNPTSLNADDGPRGRLLSQRANQMILGVSDNIAGASTREYVPIATEQMIVRKASLAKRNPPGEEGNLRLDWVRIRNSVTLCTATFSLSNSALITENTRFDNICKGPSTYIP